MPLVFILNAIIITWVGSRLDEWEKRLGKKNLFAVAFGGSAVFFILSGLFFHPNPSAIFPFLNFIPVGNKWVSFVFYLLSEIPIFLSMNLIWMLAVDYFTEQQGQKDYPKVSSIGLIGIALASALALATQGFKIFPLYYLNFLWGFLSLFLWGISWGILRRCSKLSILQESADVFTEDLEEEKEKPPPFWKTAWHDFKWIRKYPFLWLFTIVTVCNFLLLAIFDQTVANVSQHKGITGTELSVMLAKWILGFGILAALFQWFGFPKLLKKKGVARTNLYAPIFMLIGTLSYLLFASDFLEPIWARVNWDASKYLLEFVIGARIAGWIAEFLFNQSMLPFVYGAPPSQDGNRGRFFIEGPVTAITNGASGLFLLLYFWIFAQKEVGYGYKPDLLFVIALIAAIFMWIWSKRMIPLFRKVLTRRVLEGEGTDKLLSTYRPELVDDAAVLLDNVQSGKWDKRQHLHQLRLLGQTQGQKAVPTLRNFSIDEEIPAENRAAAMQELIKLNAVEAFDEIWKSFNQRKGVPAYVEIRALGEAGQHFGRTGDLKEKFNDWLNSENLDKNQIKELLRNLGAIGLDGALIVSEFINKHSEGLDEKAHQKEISQPQEFSQMDLFLIAAELGSDRFYPKLSQVARKKGLEDWRALSQIEFYDHKNVLDAFALLLDQVEDIDDGASSALIKIVRNHSWLVWPMLWILGLPFEKIPETMHGNRNVWPLLLAKALPGKDRNSDSADFPLSSIHFFEQLKDKISESCAVEFRGIDWSQMNEENIREKFPITGDANPGLNYSEFLIDRLERPEDFAVEVGTYVSFADALFELSFDLSEEIKLEKSIAYSLLQYQKTALLVTIFENWEEHAFDWLNRRQKQWLNCYLLLLGCRYPRSREFINRQTANELLDDRKRDDMLTLLEQSELPRGIFIKLRDDLALPESFAKDPNILKNYIEEGISLPKNQFEAKELWEKVSSKILEDQLLTIIMKKNKEVVYGS